MRCRKNCQNLYRFQLLYNALNWTYSVNSNGTSYLTWGDQDPDRFCRFQLRVVLINRPCRLRLPDGPTFRLPATVPRLDRVDNHNQGSQLVPYFASASQLLREDNHGSSAVAARLFGCCHRLGLPHFSMLLPYDSGSVRSGQCLS